MNKKDSSSIKRLMFSSKIEIKLVANGRKGYFSHWHSQASITSLVDITTSPQLLKSVMKQNPLITRRRSWKKWKIISKFFCHHLTLSDNPNAFFCQNPSKLCLLKLISTPSTCILRL